LYTVSTIQRSVQMRDLLLKLRFGSYNRRQELNSSEELYCIMQSLPTSHLVFAHLLKTVIYFSVHTTWKF